MTFQPLSRETLIQNGACCGSICTNCPYQPKHIKGTTLLDIKYDN